MGCGGKVGVWLRAFVEEPAVSSATVIRPEAMSRGFVGTPLISRLQTEAERSDRCLVCRGQTSPMAGAFYRTTYCRTGMGADRPISRT